MSLNVLLPRQPVPALAVSLLDGGEYKLGVPPAQTFDMVVFYRGLHCPLCAKYLTELERLYPDFAQRGIKAVAISSDGEARCREMAIKINRQLLPMGYGLSLASARVGADDLHFARENLDRHRGAADLLRTRAVPRASRRHALLG